MSAESSNLGEPSVGYVPLRFTCPDSQGNEFEDLRKRRPEVNEFLVQVLAAQVRRLSNQITDARFVPADKRIARQLLQAAGI